jgi:TPP-dependent pyruvate/acetoin dehydrogenase alpha subunit
VQDRLVGAEILSEQEAKEIGHKTQQLIKATLSYAEASLEPDVSTLTEYVYA